MTKITAASVVAAMAAASLAATPRAAPADESFYEGKTLKVIIRSSAGGGYDYYGRLMARHMPNHIPGKPNAIATNMPGAGGIIATNYMANRAARDGTEIAILPRELAISQRTRKAGVNYDVRDLIPIGSAASSTSVIVVGASLPFDSVADLKTSKETVKFGASGPGGGSYQRPMLFKFDGWPVRIISGYDGTDERVLGIARGEIHGMSASYESVLDPIRAGDLKVIGWLGNAHPEVTGVPDVRTVLSPQGRALASLMAAPMAAGRPFFTAPEVPAKRVKILRAAFKGALEDPALLKEAKRADRSIAWTDPTQMEEIYADILGAPDEVVDAFVALMSGGESVKGKVAKVEREGRIVHIGGKKIRISKSRTAVSINSKQAKRSAISVGMTCAAIAGMRKGRFEAKKIDCR